MPNNTVRASGEALPAINRRKALSLAGIGAIAIGAGIAPAAANDGDASLAGLEALIEAQASAEHGRMTGGERNG